MCRRIKKKIESEIFRLYPDFRGSEVSLLKTIQRLRRYLLRLCDAYSQDEICEEDKNELRHERNYFIIGDTKAEKVDAIEIERNYLNLIQYLELDDSVSVLMFYSKLDYINKKNARELAQIENNGR